MFRKSISLKVYMLQSFQVQIKLASLVILKDTVW